MATSVRFGNVAFGSERFNRTEMEDEIIAAWRDAARHLKAAESNSADARASDILLDLEIRLATVNTQYAQLILGVLRAHGD
jgi:hypothetical protein